MSKARRRRLKRNRKKPETKPVLLPIPQADVEQIWPLAAEFIEAGCSYGECKPEQLLADAKIGMTQLWIAWSDHCEAAVITRVLDCPEGEVCFFEAFGADNFERVRGLIPALGEWAKSVGCVSLRVNGRLGWQRMMPDFQLRWVTLDKKL
jgi:hypothetical protein